MTPIIELGSLLVSNTPLHPSERWFEDWEVGDVVTGSSSYVMEEERMVTFSEEFDPQDFHIDAEKAKDTIYGGLIASGWHTGSALMRQNTEFLGESSMGAAGIDELRWHQPVRAGDELTLTWTILEKRRSESKPDRGIIRVKQELKNQRGELAMSTIAIMFTKTRSGAA